MIASRERLLVALAAGVSARRDPLGIRPEAIVEAAQSVADAACAAWGHEHHVDGNGHVVGACRRCGGQPSAGPDAGLCQPAKIG